MERRRKNKTIRQQYLRIDKLIGAIILFLFFSSIIPDNKGPFKITKKVILDSIKYNKYSSKRGFNSEYILYSKSGNYYVINDIIHYTNALSFKEMDFPVEVEVIYRRRWFWLFGVRFIFQIKYNGIYLVDLNKYREELNFFIYLTYVFLFYIAISAIINAIMILLKIINKSSN